jgi:hypothetical protein
MKFSSFLLASLITGSSAFAPSTGVNVNINVNRNSALFDTGPSTDPVDKTLAGIDDAAEHDVFDPHAGDHPAMSRNNKGEVYIPQVSYFEFV